MIGMIKITENMYRKQNKFLTLLTLIISQLLKQ